ncbi:MAG: hypothetical protein ACLPKT_04635 [Methylocella sp.]
MSAIEIARQDLSISQLRAVGNPTGVKFSGGWYNMRYQIKGRRLTTHNKSRQLGALRDLPAQRFHFLAAVLFREDYQVFKAALIPHSRVMELAKPVQRTNSWRFILRDTVWSVPDVRDVTNDLQKAELEWSQVISEDKSLD